MTAPGKLAKILVVDDEMAIRRLLRGSLSRAGMDVVEASNAREAMAALDIDKPDLVLLDLGLPDRDGQELIGPVKASRAALLVVSARDATAQKVAALDLGADDYVTKPFDTDEVLARVRVALRNRLLADNTAPMVRFGAVEVDLAARIVRRDGAEVHLSPKEYGFLAELARYPGRVVSHAAILRAVWGPGQEQAVEYLRVAARGLRRKLEDVPVEQSVIRNEPGVGYRLML
ncbi:two-component system KDP operon response regulator KdpE [Novosphingobium sp. SG751A]|uniref:response regulator n=1 Tax=Novosphingobium sp. SG751A TaxID=2587000 RepID=UPI00155574A2|nr:response regulator transcription factor [Novosphingobium sp. SG751A]NOW45366.1 two-component system KDP operon response regulator KdpE [Novosphingobium sp. SG751A]